MKKVRKDVAHVWAHKLQNEARSLGRGNLYFNGDTIYSYGAHFPIARHVITKQGKPAVLFTTRRYSVTTSGHCYEVQSALRGLDIPVYYVKDITDTLPRRNFECLEHTFKETLKRAATARTKANYWLSEAAGQVENANSYAAAVGYRRRLKMIGDLTAIKTAVLNEKRKAMLAQKQKDKQAQADNDRRLSEWAGTPLTWQRGFDNCRLSADKLYVETTRQAIVETRFVKRALRTVLKLYATGATYQRNGEKIPVGQYILDSVDINGQVKVGCNVFDKAEVLRLAELVK